MPPSNPIESGSEFSTVRAVGGEVSDPSEPEHCDLSRAGAVHAECLGAPGIEGDLMRLGLAEVKASEIADLVEELNAPAARAQVAEFLRLVFDRIGTHSTAGGALRRALGYSGGASRRRAAAEFLITEAHLVELQIEVERRVGRPLGFAVAQPVAPPGVGSRVLLATPAPTGNCEPTPFRDAAKNPV